MKRAVWKYVLPVHEGKTEFDVAMPMGAELLCAREQANTICIWARVDPEETRVVKRRIEIALTGGPAPLSPYLGTALLHGGALVVHVFCTPAGTRSVPI